MTRTLSQANKSNAVSRLLLFIKLQRAIAAITLLAFVPATALAQYPGGGGGTGTYPGGARPSYGSKGAVIGGVAAGAAVGAGLLYWKLHNRSKLQGCVSGDGDKLVNEKDKQTYSLINKQNQSLKSGQRVEVLGKKVKNFSGEPIFEIQKMSRDLGQCTSTTAQK